MTKKQMKGLIKDAGLTIKKIKREIEGLTRSLYYYQNYRIIMRERLLVRGNRK